MNSCHEPESVFACMVCCTSISWSFRGPGQTRALKGRPVKYGHVSFALMFSKGPRLWKASKLLRIAFLNPGAAATSCCMRGFLWQSLARAAYAAPVGLRSASLTPRGPERGLWLMFLEELRPEASENASKDWSKKALLRETSSVWDSWSRQTRGWGRRNRSTQPSEVSHVFRLSYTSNKVPGGFGMFWVVFWVDVYDFRWF